MYHFSKIVNLSFEEAIAQVTESLKKEGFGILTEIDVQTAFKKKLNQDFRRYQILGACHPEIAYEMLQLDDKAGVFYPCNVVVQEHENGTVEVSGIDPLTMFLTIHIPQAKEIAIAASGKMKNAIEGIPVSVSEPQLNTVG